MGLRYATEWRAPNQSRFNWSYEVDLNPFRHGFSKSTLILLRDGDTLIKSASFANKTEEYQYEHTRNETLVSLLQVMAVEKISASELERVANHAASERGAAARLADQGDLDGAINLLDLSSRAIAWELGRVGIFIPM